MPGAESSATCIQPGADDNPRPSRTGSIPVRDKSYNMTDGPFDRMANVFGLGIVVIVLGVPLVAADWSQVCPGIIIVLLLTFFSAVLRMVGNHGRNSN